MADEPMTREQLAEIRERAGSFQRHMTAWEFRNEDFPWPDPGVLLEPDVARNIVIDTFALLAEVDRLRAENATMLPIIDAVAVDDWQTYHTGTGPECPFCLNFSGHYPDCPVLVAQAIRPPLPVEPEE